MTQPRYLPLPIVAFAFILCPVAIASMHRLDDGVAWKALYIFGVRVVAWRAHDQDALPQAQESK